MPLSLEVEMKFERNKNVIKSLSRELKIFMRELFSVKKFHFLLKKMRILSKGLQVYKIFSLHKNLFIENSDKYLLKWERQHPLITGGTGYHFQYERFQVYNKNHHEFFMFSRGKNWLNYCSQKPIINFFHSSANLPLKAQKSMSRPPQ